MAITLSEEFEVMPNLEKTFEEKDYINQIKTLEAQVKKLISQLDTKTNTNREMNQRMNQIQKKYAETLENYRDKNFNELNNSIISLTLENNELKEKISKLEQIIKSNNERETQFDQLIKRTDQKISDITEERDNLIDENLNQSKEITYLREQNNILDQKNNEMQTLINSVEDKNNQLSMRVEELIKQLNQNNPYEEMIEKLKSTIEEDNLREAALVLSLENSEKKIKELESLNQQKNKEIEIFKRNSPSELVELEKKLNESLKENSINNEQIINMTNQIQAIRQENNRLRKRLQNMDQNSLSFEHENIQLKNQCDKLNQENSQLKANINSNSDLEKRIEEMDHTIKEQKKLVDSLQKENEELRKNNDTENESELSKKVQKLINKISRLQYEFYHDDEGFLSFYTERQYHDIIITLKERLSDATMVKNMLLKERNHYKQENIQFKEEIKQLKEKIISQK